MRQPVVRAKLAVRDPTVRMRQSIGARADFH